MQRLLFKTFCGSNKFIGSYMNFGISSVQFQNLETHKIVDKTSIGSSSFKNLKSSPKILKSQDYEDLVNPKVTPVPVNIKADFNDSLVDSILQGIRKKHGVNLSIEDLKEMTKALDAAMKAKAASKWDVPFIELDIDANELYLNLENSSFIFPTKKYNSTNFLLNAQFFLKKYPPDCIACAEFLWGAISMRVREFYAQIGIMINGFHPSKCLSTFAACHHPDDFFIGFLTNTFNAVYANHKEFYVGGAYAANLELNCEQVEVFIEEFSHIDPNNVYNNIQPFLTGEKKTKDDKNLIGVRFFEITNKEKMAQEVFDKLVYFKYSTIDLNKEPLINKDI